MSTQRLENLRFEDPEDPQATGLTAQEQRFADHYVRHLNASAAARYCGISNSVAAECGWRLANRTRVRAYIARQLDMRTKAEGLTNDRVLMEIATIAMANINDYVNTDIEGAPQIDWGKVAADPRLGAAVSEITTETKVMGEGDSAYTLTKTKLKLHDKMRALSLAGEILKLIDDMHTKGEKFAAGMVEGVQRELSDREMARRIAFALQLGLRAQREPVVIEQDQFEDLT